MASGPWTVLAQSAVSAPRSVSLRAVSPARPDSAEAPGPAAARPAGAVVAP